jgi:hypothetical protein
LTAQRRPLDAYYTPTSLARRIVRLFTAGDLAGTSPIVPGSRILEPSIGGGAFAKEVRPYAGHLVGVDADPNAAGLALCDKKVIGDFLKWDPPAEEFDWVFGNPPFARPVFPRRVNARGRPIVEPIAKEHAEKALAVGRNVVLLLRAAFLETQDRAQFWKNHPARHVWFLGTRPSFTGGETDSCMYAVFWWDWNHRGPTTMSRMDTLEVA